MNAPTFIVVNELGNVIVLRYLHPLNASFPIFVTPSDMVTVLIVVLSVNDFAPITGKMTLFFKQVTDKKSDGFAAIAGQTVFVIDGKGKIVDRRSGYVDGSEQHLIEKVRELIK